MDVKYFRKKFREWGEGENQTIWREGRDTIPVPCLMVEPKDGEKRWQN